MAIRFRNSRRSRSSAASGPPTTSLAEIAGKSRTAFRYHDKGIMAMIGRDAAVAEIGRKRHELEGPVAFAAWLGVHALLMTGVRSTNRSVHRLGVELLQQNAADSGAGSKR